MKFVNEYDEESRLLESKKILLKYPSRIPIIVEKYTNCELNEIKKKKYLVPKDMVMNQFIYIIRKRINLEPSQSLFIMINNKLVTSSDILGNIYDNESNKDGFLYMTYTSENTFG